MDKSVLTLVQKFVQANKPFASICHDQLILAAAGVVSNKTCTAYPAVKPALIDADCQWVEADTGDKCVVDGNLITGANYDAHPKFIIHLIFRFGLLCNDGCWLPVG
jgi:D-lactate dehydratase